MLARLVAPALSKYTEATLRAACGAYGVALTEDDDAADMFLVSCNDPDSLPMVRRVAKTAKGRPVIMGGVEGFCGEAYLAWADAVIVGEGFEFLRVLGRDGLAGALGLPCVMRKDRLDPTPSAEMDWPLFPLMHNTKRGWYYMAQRGCKGKCAFCLTGWAHERQQNHAIRLKRAIAAVAAKPHGHKLTMITNESEGLPYAACLNAQSVRVRDYIRAPARWKSYMLHMGVERFADDERRAWGKPIRNEELRAMMNITGERGQQIEIFLVMGLDSDNDTLPEFLDCVPTDTALYPRMYLKFTHLSPMPHTPLWAMDLTELRPFDGKAAYWQFLARNKRFRRWPDRAFAKCLWRSLFHRCGPEQALTLGPMPDTKVTREEFVAGAEKRGLGALMRGGGAMANARIKMPLAGARDKAAARLGLPPVLAGGAGAC